MTGAGAKTEGIAGFDYDVLTQKPFRRNDVEDKEIEDALNEVCYQVPILQLTNLVCLVQVSGKHHFNPFSGAV